MQNLPVSPWPGADPDGWLSGLRKDLELLTSGIDRMLQRAWGLVSAGLPWPWSQPPVALEDAGADVVVRVQAPGLDPASVDVRVGPTAVYVRGTARQEYRQEQPDRVTAALAYGEFRTAVPLPAPVDPSRATAAYQGGVLEVRAPKLPPVPVQGA